MIAALLLAALATTALLAAASLRLHSLVSALLAAYLVVVGESIAITTTLSPFRAVTRGGLAAAEGGLLGVALLVWWRHGRPRLPLASRGRVVREILGDPIVAVLALAVAAALAYELALVLTVPPNNWDSLTYHLSRAAAWAQHGGVHWIPNAPTDRLNEFQPLAEQEILLLFVATGKGALFALPQFVAELAILVALYGIARRLGHGVRAATWAALVFATFTLVGLEATTAQNDLVAASLAAAAGALLLGGNAVETVLAGIAVGLGLGVKLTTAFVLPVLVAIAVVRGRRSASQFGAAAGSAFLALGMWGYVVNLAETGHVLGHGGGRIEHSASPSFPGSVSTAFRAVYRLFDLSGFDIGLLRATAALTAAGVLGAVVVARRRGREPRRMATAVLLTGLPLLTPVLALDLASVAHGFAAVAHLPVQEAANTSGRFAWTVGRRANEDLSAFGPFGGVALVGVSAATLAAGLRKRAAPSKIALALALPLFVVLLALTSKYNPWLSRFLIVPAALTAPLLAGLFRRREAAAAIVAVTTIVLGLAMGRNELKPLRSEFGRPWQLTQAEAVKLTFTPQAGAAREDLDRVVPGPACLGAVLGGDEPSYLLFGSRLQRRVTFLPRESAPQAAERSGVPYVVIGAHDVQGVSVAFAQGGWALRPLSYWTLAISPRGGSGRCFSQAAVTQAAA